MSKNILRAQIVRWFQNHVTEIESVLWESWLVKGYGSFIRGKEIPNSNTVLQGYNDLVANEDGHNIFTETPRSKINYIGWRVYSYIWKLMPKRLISFIKSSQTIFTREDIEDVYKEFRAIGKTRVHTDKILNKPEIDDIPLESQSLNDFSLNINTTDLNEWPTFIRALVQLIMDEEYHQAWRLTIESLLNNAVQALNAGRLYAIQQSLFVFYDYSFPDIISKLSVLWNANIKNFDKFEKDSILTHVSNVYSSIYDITISDNKYSDPQMSTNFALLIYCEVIALIRTWWNALRSLVPDKSDNVKGFQRDAKLSEESSKLLPFRDVNELLYIVAQLLVYDHNSEFTRNFRLKKERATMNALRMAVNPAPKPNGNTITPNMFFNSQAMLDAKQKNVLRSANIWYISKTETENLYNETVNFLLNLNVCKFPASKASDSNYLVVRESFDEDKNISITGLCAVNIHVSTGSIPRECYFRRGHWVIMTMSLFCNTNEKKAELMDNVKSLAQRQKCDRIHVSVVPEDIGFYRSQGFENSTAVAISKSQVISKKWDKIDKKTKWTRELLEKDANYLEFLNHLISFNLATNENCVSPTSFISSDNEYILGCNEEGYEMTFYITKFAKSKPSKKKRETEELNCRPRKKLELRKEYINPLLPRRIHRKKVVDVKVNIKKDADNKNDNKNNDKNNDNKNDIKNVDKDIDIDINKHATIPLVVGVPTVTTFSPIRVNVQSLKTMFVHNNVAQKGILERTSSVLTTI